MFRRAIFLPVFLHLGLYVEFDRLCVWPSAFLWLTLMGFVVGPLVINFHASRLHFTETARDYPKGGQPAACRRRRGDAGGGFIPTSLDGGGWPDNG